MKEDNYEYYYWGFKTSRTFFIFDLVILCVCMKSKADVIFKIWETLLSYIFTWVGNAAK